MLPYHRKLLSGLSGGSFAVEAVTFDGSNDYLSRGSDLTGNADGKKGTISFWLKTPVSVPDTQYIISNNVSTSLYFGVGVNRNESITIQGRYFSGGLITILQGTSNLGLLADTNWHHVLISFNLATGAFDMYIDDANEISGTPTTTNQSIDYTGSDWFVGSYDTYNIYEGDLAELYFIQEYIDLSVEANRRKFYSAAGKPVDLGADGSIPTGNQPIIYLSNRPGDSASDFATNQGSGGDFTENGALAIASTSPSD